MSHFPVPHHGVAFWAAIAVSAGGCAGPNTPLGAVSWMSLSNDNDTKLTETRVKQDLATRTDLSPRIEFIPSRQVLHSSAPVALKVNDPFGSTEDYELTVRYNGLDVTRSFLFTANVRLEASGEIRIHVPKVTLSPDKTHEIEFLYKSRTGATAYGALKAPECFALRPATVQNTWRFRPPLRLIEKIEKHSMDAGLNPAFVAALVAQESGFDRGAVSWARAVGLTQITPLAESEIARAFPNWPRYPNLNKMPAPLAKAMILRGRVTASNEWRLDEEKSVRGGIHFTRELASKWSTPERVDYLRKTFRDPEAEHTRLLLASYNSGYFRVKSALKRYGRDWIEHPELREARRYVNQVFSYCYHFSRSEHELEPTAAYEATESAGEES